MLISGFLVFGRTSPGRFAPGLLTIFASALLTIDSPIFSAAAGLFTKASALTTAVVLQNCSQVLVARE